MKDFLATAKDGLAKLERRHRYLLKKLDQVHDCNCDFCDRKGDTVRSHKIQAEIQEVEAEKVRIENYLRDHANV